MFPTQIIYTSANTAVLQAILNGVAMVANLDSLIWGVATAAGVWQVVMGISKAPLDAAKTGQSTMTTNSISIVIALVMAMALTNSQMKTAVIVENQITGVATEIANVPFIVSVIPSAASILAKEIGTAIEQAYQGTNAQYSIISSGQNGFITPLKVLLSARTAMGKLGDVNSQIKQVVNDCLGPDSNVDYAALNAQVMYAGNITPTANAQFVSINGSTIQTSIGALLSQAALNPTAKVNITISDGSTDLPSCVDAVNFVNANITTAMNSTNYIRAAVGAINNQDDPTSGANKSFENASAQYNAIRTMNTTTTGNLAGGVAQSTAEMINLMFYSTVKENMDCIKSNGDSKTQCLAQMAVVDAQEQTNIDNAANASIALAYAGQFGNIFLALIIGLSPVIIIFMMFAGVNAGKNIKVATHMIVWPMLIYNVGGVVVNGIIYTQISNFMAEVSQAGVLNQMMAGQLYRNFSMQLGTASALMAGLPILMSTIFVLGESAAAVAIANSIGGKDRFNEKTLAPDASSPSAISATRPASTADVHADGTAVNALSGSAKSIQGSIQQNSIMSQGNQTAEQSITRAKQISQGEQVTNAVASGDVFAIAKAAGVSTETAKAIKEEYSHQEQIKHDATNSQGAQKAKSNSQGTSLAVKAQASTGGLPSVGVEGSTSADAKDTTTSTKDSKTSDSASKADSLSKAITKVMGSKESNSLTKTQQDSLSNIKTATDTYGSSLTETKQEKLAHSQSLSNAEGIVGAAAPLTTSMIASQSGMGGQYGRFVSKEGRGGQAIDAIKHGPDAARFAKYQEEARAQMRSGEVESIVGNDPMSVRLAEQNIINTKATEALMRDKDASELSRANAQVFVTGSFAAASGNSPMTLDAPKETHTIGTPTNKTGVVKEALVAKKNAAPIVAGPDQAIQGAIDAGDEERKAETSKVVARSDALNGKVEANVAQTGNETDGTTGMRTAKGVVDKVANVTADLPKGEILVGKPKDKS